MVRESILKSLPSTGFRIPKYLLFLLLYNLDSSINIKRWNRKPIHPQIYDNCIVKDFQFGGWDIYVTMVWPTKSSSEVGELNTVCTPIGVGFLPCGQVGFDFRTVHQVGGHTEW